MKNQNLIQSLNGLLCSAPHSVNRLSELFQPFSHNRSTVLWIADYSNPVLYFFETGLVRGYCIRDGEENTSWITDHGFFIQSAMNGNNGMPPEYIHFIEKTEGWYISIKKLTEMADTDPNLFHLLLKLYSGDSQEYKSRALMLRMNKAEERFLYFKEKYSYLFFRVPNKILASFLKIDSKYLFKIKKNNLYQKV